MKDDKYWWDRAWSLSDGCTPCSPGCEHCWSAGMTWRFNKEPGLIMVKGKHWFFSGKVIIHPDRLSIPLKRRKPTVYAVWNDLFHEAVPIEFQSEAYRTIATAYQHTFLILTKRPQIMVQAFNRNPGRLDRGNAYHGITVCNQQEADEKIPVFLQVPGKKFLNIEPMLGPVDIGRVVPKIGAYGCLKAHCKYAHADDGAFWCDKQESCSAPIDAVLLGGETLGNKPGRKIEIEWAESIAEQCSAAGVPLFVKQLHIGGKVSKDMAEWPEKLRRRELPWLKKDR